MFEEYTYSFALFPNLLYFTEFKDTGGNRKDTHKQSNER